MGGIIRGQVLGQGNVGVPNLGVELWKANSQGNPTGEGPLLKTVTLLGGGFYLNLAQPPSGTTLPEQSCIIFRDRSGVEQGRQLITPEILAGHILRYQTTLEAETPLAIWLKPYSPSKQVADDIKPNLALAPHEGLVTQVAPEVSFFSSFLYLEPDPETWPWPVGDEEISQDRALDQEYLLGVDLTYRQEWHLLGYARGELLHSLPLAPGEETTIEVLTWDRNVYKREEEITDDIEREIEQNRHYKESREVFREMKETERGYIDVQVSGKANFIVGSVSTKVKGGWSKQVDSHNKTTMNNLLDTTDRAVNKVRNQRKTVISSTRELGREEKVSRRISNTNRCQTVTYHFYEVLQNFQVKNTLTTPVRPCLFVKRVLDVSRDDLRSDPQEKAFYFALRWMHVNSHLIAKALLDRSLSTGLKLLPKMVAYWMLHRGAAMPEVDIDPYLKPHIESFITATRAVKDAECWTIQNCYDQDEYYRTMLKSNIIFQFKAPWLFDLILGTEEGSLEWHKNNEKHDVKNDLAQAVDNFFDAWDTGMAQVPALRALIEMEGFRKFLYQPLVRLRSEYGRWVYGAKPAEEPSGEELERLGNVAEIVRLMRHVADNYLYYARVIWGAEDPGERLHQFKDRMLPGQVPLVETIENKLLGFYGDYAIFPFKNVVEGSAVDDLVQEFENLPEEAQNADPFDVVLPTNGITVEPQLGEFTACEPFIQEHRKHDLQLRALEVQKAEVENQRRNKKIRNCELENPECCPTPKYGFFHRLFYSFKGNNKE